jgi:isoleucyl-tRNA synthetase
VIWTTTAWTIPANQALNLNPSSTTRWSTPSAACWCWPSRWWKSACERYGLQGKVLATVGREARRPQLPPPAGHVHAGYDRLSPVYLADYATADDGTGIVHSSAGLWPGRLQLLRRARHEGRRHPQPGAGQRRYAADFPLFGGQDIWKAVPVIIETLREPAACWPPRGHHHSYPHCWRHKTPVIYRAAAQWFVRMDEGEGVFTKDKARRRCARLALDAIDHTGFYPENGRARLRDMIANRPDWCISRQRSWGVPLPFFLHKDTGELHPRTMEILDQAADIVEQGGIEAWSRVTAEEILAPPTRRTTPRAATSSRSGSTRQHLLARAARHPPGRATADPATTKQGPRPTSTSKATTSTAAGSTARCCWAARSTAARPTAAC